MNLATQEPEKFLYPLLNYITQNNHPSNSEWQTWRITQVTGGANNLLYRATGPGGDFAVKFTIRDQRDRAGREYGALLALHQAQLSLAPKPILLDQERYVQPVIVQSWLEGEVMTMPPNSEAEWQSLIAYYATIHTLKQGSVPVKLLLAVLSARSVKTAREIVEQQVAHLPKEAQPASLQRLLRQFQRTQFPDWPEPSLTLCRVDPNPLNFIRRPGLWGSVDWENSGWGDPAFEIADLMTHPAYLDVPASQRELVVDLYCQLAGDPTATQRIYTYYRIMLVWWVARLARYLYEVPRGLDERLVQRPANWLEGMQTKYEYYLSLAIAEL